MNKEKPSEELIALYSAEGEIVENDLTDDRIVFADLLGKPSEEVRRDLIKRSLIRHDSKKLAQELIKIVDNL
jgi:hypothetical protein